MGRLEVVKVANLQCREKKTTLPSAFLTITLSKTHSCVATEMHENIKTHSHTHKITNTAPSDPSHLFLMAAFTDTKCFGAVPSGIPAAHASCADP